MEKNTRTRKYLLTLNNPQQHGITPESIQDALRKYSVLYCCMCAETGSLGTYHYHVYIYFENAIYFSTIKAMFPTANIAPAQGTSQQNRSYILKDSPIHNKKKDGSYEYMDSKGTLHKGTNHGETFYELGTCPQEQQGRRSDLEQMYALIQLGYSNKEILDQMPDTAIKHIDRINKVRQAYLLDKFRGQRRLDLKVNYVTGTTGCGKSRDILDEYGDENVYRVTDYMHPFDSYQEEPVIVFEEYRSSLRCSDMLNYLDVYPVTLPARYAPKVGCFTTIFIVSNWTFEDQYAELQKDPYQKSTYNAWVRRFNGYVKEYFAFGKYKKYDSIQEYLDRNKHFTPLPKECSTPFDEPEQEKLPFE